MEFVTILLLFYAMFSCFGYKVCGMLAAQPGTEPSPSALEGKVVATGLPPKRPVRRKAKSWPLDRHHSLSVRFLLHHLFSVADPLFPIPTQETGILSLIT